ncbi:hypothetical protein TOPH_06850, partial [Tolypocladium ophioglossoides CBS 100239]
SSSVVTDANSLEFFAEHGLLYQEDAPVGGIVATLDQKGLSNNTDGFKFIAEHLLTDSRIRPILKPYLSQDNPQVCSPFSADPGHIFAFSTAPVIGKRIVVYAWGAGSHMEFYANSHIKELKGVRASNGLLEIAEASLKRNGCTAISVRMEKGGIAILHPRHAFRIREGFTNAYGLEITGQVKAKVSHQ